MNRTGQTNGLWAGLLASAFAGVVGTHAVLTAGHAFAQTFPAASGTERAGLPNGRPAIRPPTRPGPDEEPAAATPAQPAEPGSETTDDTPPPRLRLGRRPVVDGDTSFPAEPTQPVDGVILTEEPEETPDGVDPNQLDTRDPEDIAAFERPAAGFDPSLYAVEIEPILDRRPARLARFEPYQHVGIRVGSFTMFAESEFAFAAYDNLFRSSGNVRRDIALDIRPSVRFASNWNRHALEFRATGLTNFHNQFPGEDDRAYLVETRGRIDISRLTNVEGLVSRERTQEIRGSINAASRIGDRADIDTTRATLAVNQRFNRLTIQLRGSMTQTDFSPVDTGNGVIASNASRDNVFKEAAVRATWAFKPTLAVFGESVVNERTYREAPADGIKRDSTGDRTRLGVSFGTTSQVLRGEASVGYAQQRFDDTRLLPISGVIFDANLGWRMSGLTSLLLTARGDVSEATILGSGGALSQSAGVELRHAFRRHLIGTAALRLTKTDYDGISLHERDLTSILGLEYFLTREVTLFSRYQHVDFESTLQSRNYNADEVRAGVRVRL